MFSHRKLSISDLEEIHTSWNHFSFSISYLSLKERYITTGGKNPVYIFSKSKYYLQIEQLWVSALQSDLLLSN